MTKKTTALAKRAGAGTNEDELPLINFSDPEQQNRIVRHLMTLQGVHEVKLKKIRDGRSKQQNAYYWGVVLPYVAKGMRDAAGETVEMGANSHDAHAFLKDRFLARPVICKTTGELIGKVEPSTKRLDTAAFAAYLEHVLEFARDYLCVEIPPATKYVLSDDEIAEQRAYLASVERPDGERTVERVEVVEGELMDDPPQGDQDASGPDGGGAEPPAERKRPKRARPGRRGHAGGPDADDVDRQAERLAGIPREMK